MATHFQKVEDHLSLSQMKTLLDDTRKKLRIGWTADDALRRLLTSLEALCRFPV